MDEQPLIELNLDAEAEARRQEILRCKAEGTEIALSNSVKREREYSRRRRAAGICSNCPNASIPGRMMCKACRDKYNEKHRLKYVRK